MIPKQIFKIWISDKPTPKQFDKYISTWGINKGFEIINVNTCDYTSPFLEWAKKRKAYTLINHYLRCKLLYDKGGVYLDLDIECVRPLDALLNEPFIVGIEDSEVVNNAVIISQKGHPFLLRCLEYMDKFRFREKDVELETGPRMFTNVAKEFGWTKNHVGYFSGIRILKPEYFYPYHYTEVLTQDHITENTYCIHHWNNSWGDLVSIVIPCYNQAKYLPTAIDSCLKQTYKNIEIIVVNDGSPDNTSEVVKRYPEVRLVEQANKGLSGARNSGIKASKGKWILTLDADDKLHPRFIEKTINKADVVSTWLETYGDTNQLWKPPVAVPELKHFLKHNCINCCSLFKREVYNATGGYDETMTTGYEDWEFWTHAAKCGFKFHIVQEPLFYYHRHGHSMFHDAIKSHVKNSDYIRKKHAKAH